MTQEQLDHFYSKVSFMGLLTLFAFKLSLDKKIAFDRDHLTKEIGVGLSDYLFGFLVACTSFDILRYNSKIKVITPTYLDPLIDQTITEKVYENSKQLEQYKVWLDKVPPYFSL